jgi:hypothetical protein
MSNRFPDMKGKQCRRGQRSESEAAQLPAPLATFAHACNHRQARGEEGHGIKSARRYAYLRSTR